MSCSRASLKRTRDMYDLSSFASSTPPQRLPKRFHLDSDVSVDTYNPFHQPSDSPTNPFKRNKTFSPRALLRSSPSGHLILRFQLGQQPGNVHRIVCVPDHLTFWHLARLTQFLFGWKDTKKVRNPYNRNEKIERRAEHVFTVQKRVVFYSSAKHAGIFKEGKTVVHVAEKIKEIRSLCEDDAPWEREERYTLRDLWHHPGRYSESSRALIFEYDVFSAMKDVVYISIVNDLDKLDMTQSDLDEIPNVPFVLQGQGLPDDEEDDDDFPLDLQQWNEPDSFEKYILSQTGEDEEDERPASVRLAEEQDLVKKRMTAPLPKKLPIDEENIKEPEVEDVPPKLRMLTSLLKKAAKEPELEPESEFETAIPSASPDPTSELTSELTSEPTPKPLHTRKVVIVPQSPELEDIIKPVDDDSGLGFSPIKKKPSRIFRELEGNHVLPTKSMANPFRRKSTTTLSEIQKQDQKLTLGRKYSAIDLRTKISSSTLFKTKPVADAEDTPPSETRRETELVESEGEI